MPDFGVAAEFFDEDRRLGFWTGLSQAFARIVIRRTGIGWNIGQALRTLPRLRHYDCIFATTDSTGLPLAFLKRCGILKIPLVVASQGLCNSLDKLGWNRWFGLHKWSMEAVDHFVVYGWSEQHDLCSRFGVPPDKVSWVPFGVDLHYFSKVMREGQQNNGTILSVGRDRCRDFELLLKVAARLPFKFRLISSRGRLANLDIPGNVDVRYDLTIKELCHEYAVCRFVILPVTESSYSLATTTLMEALNLRKPVIVTRTRAAGDKDGGYGFKNGIHCRFVPVADEKALECAIRELWNDEKMCDRLATAGGEYVQRFTSKDLAKRVAGIFRSVVDARKS
jgi:glycosyltransferase involved in cell wall biosynthesis